jgi:Shikimate kinase
MSPLTCFSLPPFHMINLGSQPPELAWQRTTVAPCGTHHLLDGLPIYSDRFVEVLKYNPPGLAAVRTLDAAYHITPAGTPAYPQRYLRTFGFYEGRSAVVDLAGQWFHVKPNGEAVYHARYAWCGNYQGGRVTVRDFSGHYFHLDLDGSPPYQQRHLYAGDYRDGIACVRFSSDGLCRHVNVSGNLIHEATYLDLDVYHKGFARARDSAGWCHIGLDGRPRYDTRYAAVEPFYNGMAYCETWSGDRVIVDESGRVGQVLWSPMARETPQLALLIIGNVGTGKTTLARRLAAELGWANLSIDAMRSAIADCTAAGELAAWAALNRAVEQSQKCLIECSGSGPMVHLLKHTLAKTGKRCHVLWLDAPVEVCVARIASKRDLVPYPDFGVPLNQVTVELGPRIESEIRNGIFWKPSEVTRLDATLPEGDVLSSATLAVRRWLQAGGDA